MLLGAYMKKLRTTGVMLKLGVSFTILIMNMSALAKTNPSDPHKGKKSEVAVYKADKVTQVEGIPWSIEFKNPEEMFIAVKEGKLILYNLKTKTSKEIKGAPASQVHGQGGLLDIMLHPDFAKNSKMYFSYTKKVGDAFTTAVALGQIVNDEVKDLKDLFVANPANKNGVHFGSRIVHDGEGYIYFSVGDRGERDLAQKLEVDQGKIHRLTLDGKTPSDNPFVKNRNARKTIWSWGHRNPQGMVYDFKNKILYEHEHGPRGGDEINIIKKGKNYGWPLVTFGKEYYGPKISNHTSKKGFEDPIYQYTPSIAPSGLELYTGQDLSGITNKLVLGALAYTHVNVLNISDLKNVSELRLFRDKKERVRDVKQSPDQKLYYTTDSGNVYRIDKIKMAQ